MGVPILVIETVLVVSAGAAFGLAVVGEIRSRATYLALGTLLVLGVVSGTGLPSITAYRLGVRQPAFDTRVKHARGRRGSLRLLRVGVRQYFPLPRRGCVGVLWAHVVCRSARRCGEHSSHSGRPHCMADWETH